MESISSNLTMHWQTLGFDLNKNFFEHNLQNGNLSHAYLFTGQEMTGKKTFALELAKIITRAGFENNPNLFFIGGTGSVSIDQIRGFKKFLSLKPYLGGYKIGVIDNCHLMTTEAANALLKVLEEPPAFSLIILITSNPGQLLPTIYSRCEEIKFNPCSKSEILKYLGNLGLDKAQSEFLADFSNGRLGLAYRMKEEDSFGDIRKTLEEFNGFLKSDINERLNFAEEVFKKEEDGRLQSKMLFWMFYLRSDLSQKLKINRAKVLRKILETNYILSKPQFNHRLAFENLLISL